MKIIYFTDTDTLYIVFSQKTPAETRDLDVNTLLDLDEDGQLCSKAIASSSIAIIKTSRLN